MRKENRAALLVGIDHYSHGIKPLAGCVNDVKRIRQLLEKNGNGDENFCCKELVSSAKSAITHEEIRKAIKIMIQREPDMALFYFSGHGYGKKGEGGFLVCQDTTLSNPESGYRMNTLLDDLYRSSIPEIVVILDCCHSGFLGDVDFFDLETTNIRKGVTLLSATRYNELAAEKLGQGVFTRILCEGLEGAAADQWGNITAANLYALAERTLSPWEQRPTFRSFVNQIRPIRENLPQKN